MSEETPPPPTQKIRTEPLSMVSLGPLNALIFNMHLERADEPTLTQTCVRIARIPLIETDEPNVIPLLEIPALIEMLKGVARGSVQFRDLQPAPTQPAKPTRAPKKRKS